jgi:alkylhydroperoxidase family enzyme
MMMRLSEPRIPPIDLADATDEQREMLAPFDKTLGVLNIFKTMARTPRALKRFNVWGGYVLGHGTSLSPRAREIVILRTGWLCRAGYEWVQHTRIGLDAGLSDEEIEAIKIGADAPGWSPADAALLAATDDLVRDHFISDERWRALGDFTDVQRMDLVYTVGQYTLVSMLLNSFGVQLDEGQTLDPDFPR